MKKPDFEAFARDILADFPENSPDEFGVQEIAVKHGVLVAHQIAEPCGERCWCTEFHGEFPVTCYRLWDSEVR